MSHDEGSCAYKRLYEGSQVSLSDMASKQASALKRASALREGILSMLKQHFSAEFANAENTLGKRLTGVPDDVLLAFMSSFMAMPLNRTAARESLVEENLTPLREALEATGVTLPRENDPKAWAEAVHMAHARRTPASAPASTPEEPLVVTHDLLEDLFGDAKAYSNETDQYGIVTEDAPFELEEPPEPPYDEPSENDLYELFGDPGPEGDEKDEHEDLFTDGPLTGSGSLSVLDVLSGIDQLPPGDKPLEAQVLAKPGQQLGLPGSDTVKPEIVPMPARPVSRKGRGRKETRVAATRPEDQPEALKDAEDINRRILEKVLSPRPIFTSDLTAGGFTPEQVAAWESQCKSEGTAAPVRFLVPKPRHRERGALVLPHEQIKSGHDAWAGSTWGKTASDPRLRGARLYELAVLVKRNEGKVKSIVVTDHAATLGLTAARGLVYTVFISDADMSETSLTRTALAEQVEGLLGQRATMLAVATSAPDGMGAVAAALQAEAAKRGWKVAVPVVVAQSWLFDPDGGATLLEALP